MRMECGDAGIISHGVKWAVQNIDNTYPKTLIKAKAELRHRGLDPGDENYGLARVLESGEVRPAGEMWKKSDIDLAIISLAELGCIEPWIHVCKCFHIRPADYAKAHRTAAENSVDRLGQYAEEPLFYRYEFAFGNNLVDFGSITITLRDDWERILRQSFSGTPQEGNSDAAEER